MPDTNHHESGKSHTRRVAWSFAVFIFGLTIGLLVHRADPSHFDRNSFSLSPNRKADPGHKLINPLLECEFGENSFAELRSFGAGLEKFVDSINERNKGIDFVSVYFRDLNNGPWFGINEKTDFAPASLLKLPIMIVYFKEAERNPSLLDKEYVFKDDGTIPRTQQIIVPEKTLEVGKKYTVSDLIYRMIVYSDNLAQHVLVENINLGVVAEVFRDFSIALPSPENPNTTIDVQTYGRFFRVLFNGSYLTKDYSEKALELLAEAKFKEGLVAGVPQGITVAHKFGERELPGEAEQQLHDCGIIYYPEHPYLLCIMSRGNNSEELKKNH